MKTFVYTAIALMAGLTFCLLTFCLPAQAAENADKLWFQPTLVDGSDPDCAPILGAAKARFATDAQWNDQQGPLPAGFAGFRRTDRAGANGQPDVSTASVKVVSDDNLLPLEKDGAKIHLSFENHIGCGGGCDSESVHLTAILASGRDGAIIGDTSIGKIWSVYTSKAGAHFLIGNAAENGVTMLEAWRVARPGQWKMSCRIAVMPDMEKSTDAVMQATLRAVQALNQTSLGMSRGGGPFCGTLQAGAHAEYNAQQALRQTLYRPWALPKPYQGTEMVSDFLGKWALGGLSEQESWRAYQDQIARTQKQLADFYRAKFGWSQDRATVTAAKALPRAIAMAYVFGTYTPPDNLALRAAILAHKPLADIQAIAIVPPAKGDTSETLLNIAVRYPQALDWLLGQGLDPNQANDFDKTPLMYAAQYNQLEAARILLAHGADPNARTVMLDNGCGISVRTRNMTPLHYAARYAGGDLIRLLMDKGAVSFIKASNDDWSADKRAPEETALDWLAFYDGGKGEQNPNLKPADLPGLTALLQPPKDLPAFAKTKAALGDSLLKAGKREAGYQALTLAQAADARNALVISDLPIAAFDTGRLGIAARAATAALDQQARGAQAAAWFNMGLICDAATRTNFDLDYDGETYCSGDVTFDFLNAWQIQPTAARAAKLASVMQTGSIRPRYPQVCVVGDVVYRFGFDFDHSAGGARERVYALHKPGQPPDLTQIVWDKSDLNKGAISHPTFVGTYDLGDRALTVMDVPRQFGGPRIGGQKCPDGK